MSNIIIPEGCTEGKINISKLTGNVVINAITKRFFDINYNLINCTSSNNISKIIQGKSYSTTIKASTGYDLSLINISIFMDNIDVTNNVYNNGEIFISSVIGDVDISAT